MSEEKLAVNDTNSTLGDEKAGDSQVDQYRGRAIFLVDVSGAGLVVRTGFLTEQNQVMELPAVFPDLSYALNQIDTLRQLVIERFAQAAQVGIQLMAAGTAQEQNKQMGLQNSDLKNSIDQQPL